MGNLGLWPAIVLMAGLSAGCQALAETKSSSLVVSISPFPYDKTAEAVETVNRIVRENSNLYTVQLDNGIPWDDASKGKAYSGEVMGQWERHKKAHGANTVYLAIAPLAEDRTSWAPSAEGKKSPDWARDEKHATASLKSAYARHVLQAIEYFHPDYVNIGVEAGDMAAKKAGKMAALRGVVYRLRETNPREASIGQSWHLFWSPIPYEEWSAGACGESD